MVFTFEIRSQTSLAATATIIMVVHGIVMDPSAIAVTVNGVDRLAQWSGNELVFELPVEVEFVNQGAALVHEFEWEDLPRSTIEVLNAISEAGGEAGVVTCDLCQAIVPARLIQAFTICACPACQEAKRLKSSFPPKAPGDLPC
jgi:hypothetical protein